MAYWLPGYYLSEAAAFFAPQFIFLSIAVALLACILSRSLGYTTPVLAALWLTLGLGTYDQLRALTPPEPAGDPEKVFTLMSLNLERFEYDDTRLMAVINNTQPDLVLFQETGAATPRLQALLADTYTHAIVPPDGHDSDLTVFSKLPLSDVQQQRIQSIPLSYGKLNAYIEFTVETAQTPIKVYAVHPTSPHIPSKLLARTTYLETIAAKVAQRTNDPDNSVPVIVAGDWNTSPWSKSFPSLLEEMSLTTRFERGFPRNTRYFFAPELADLAGSQVDHIAVSAPLSLSSVKVAADVGSDHLPLIANVDLPKR